MPHAFRNTETNPTPHRTRFIRALLALSFVVTFGTGGILVVEENWTVWKALYFTLITITTVGYGDMGLSEAGQRFTTVLLVVGIATSTYAFSQLIQAAIAYQLDWRSRMLKTVGKLEGHSIVCGAGRVGRSVCERLLSEDRPFVLVDSQEESMAWAKERGYLIITGCATDDETLRAAGIENAYGLVCATSSDADNIMTCLSARELNPKLIIVSRADDVDSVRKLERAGASHVVAPAIDGGRELASLLMHPHVARFLRESHEAQSHYRMTAVPIVDGCSLVGRTTREVGMEEPTLVFVAIQGESGETKIRPRADECFRAGDTVIIVGDPDSVERLSMKTCIPAAAVTA